MQLVSPYVSEEEKEAIVPRLLPLIALLLIVAS